MNLVPVFISFYIGMQSTPDKSNRSGEIEKGSSYRKFEARG